MKYKRFLLWLMLLMGAVGMQAKEAYYELVYNVETYDDGYEECMSCTFTFYYDDLRATRGETRSVTQNGQSLNFSFQHVESEVYINFDSSFADFLPTNTSYWFYHLDVGIDRLLTFQNLQNLNTSEVTNMSHMFDGILCDGLYTGSFDDYSGIDVRHFDTRKVTDMSYMFTNINTSVTFQLDLSSFTINANCNTEGMMSNSFYNYIDRLIIPATANNLANNACSGFGEYDEPGEMPELIYPEDFIFTGATQYDGYFTWKGGNFSGTIPSSPYAVLNGSTLKFYYDNNRRNYTTTYDLNTGTTLPEWSSNASSVTSVVFTSSFAQARPTSCYKWFANMSNLQSITGFAYLNTSEVTDMSRMFYNCYGMTSLNVSELNTEKVTDMSYMFYNCHGLTSLNVSRLNTSKVTDMSFMFYNCYGLSNLNVSGFNTSEVTNMSRMFHSCSKLTSLDVSGFNTSKVTDMQYMFYDCSKLTSLDVSHFDTSNVTDMQWMFNICSELESLDLSGFTFNSGTSTSKMLTYCSGLKHLYIPATAINLNSDACTYVGTQSAPCSLGYPEGFTPEKTSTGNGWYQWKSGYFKDAASEPYVVLLGSTMTFCYDDERNTRDGVTFSLNTGNSNPEWTGYRSTVTQVEFNRLFANARPTTCYSWFTEMGNLTSITGIENLNTDEVTNMEGMFELCTSLQSLDLSGFNTGSVTNMRYMFNECSNLTSLDVSGFNTSNVTRMDNMFRNCSSLTSLDVSGFDTSSATTMARTFDNCSSLTSLDLSSFTFNSGVSTTYFLENGSSLKQLTVPSTANNIDFNAFIGVGTETAPCVLIYPESATITPTSTGDGWFAWKSGYFKETDPEPYTVLDGTTLTFYYNNKRRSHTTTYDLNTESALPGWNDNATSVTSVVFDSSFADARPTSCYHWFDNMRSLASITGMEYLNTDEVTNMNGMFTSCSSLTSLDVSGFNTANVTDMASMFQNCSNLTSLPLSGFNTDNVTSMSNLFAGCNSLTSLNLQNFNTTSVTYMTSMFAYCSSLTNLDLSSFTFNSNNTNSANMMKDCSSLQSLTIPSTAINLNANACYAVGTEDEPCTLIYPDGFTLNPSDTGEGWFLWKSGYFIGEPKAYAVCDGSKLTFYYDGLYSTRPGTVYDLNSGQSYPGWYYELYHGNEITSVEFNSSFAAARPTSCYGWFAGMDKITSITGIEYLITDEVTTMQYMFIGCKSLTSLDLSSFNTTNVTNMGQMFYWCPALTSLNLSSFNTTNVTDMGQMFYQCSALTSLDVSGFNTANVTYMESMFESCSSLTNLDLSNFNTENVVYMYEMFENCSSLTNLDLSSFNTANAIYYDGMFHGCSNLKGLDLSNFTFSENTTTDYLLNNCSSLKTLAIPATASYLNAEACEGVGTEDEPCTLITPDGSIPQDAGQETGYFTWKSGYFKLAEARPYAVLSTDNTTLTFYCDARSTLRKGTVYELNTSSTIPGWNANASSVTSVVFDSSFADARPKTCYYWFTGMTNLTSITDIEYLKTDEVTSMHYMFRNCSNLTSLDVSGFNTANVTRMYETFNGCSKLTSLDVSGFNTDKVTDMTSMFYNCSSLTSLDVSGFNTANVTSMGNMFAYCSSLTSLDVSGFNTANVTKMNSMFGTCSKLTSLDVSGFNTANVTDMNSMFLSCAKLTSLDVSGFNTAKVTNMSYMFYSCSKLTSLDLSGFNTEKVNDMRYMFTNCSSLQSLDLSHFTFKSNLLSANMLKNCSGLQTLTIPATANNIDSEACYKVGTATNPCTLVYPAGMTLDKTGETDTYFIWKSGYFKDAFLPGDANGDGSVSVSDVMMTVDYVLGLEPEGFHFDNANVAGGDNMVTVSDVMGIVDIALGLTINQAPPQARYSGADAIGLSATRSQCTVVLENSEPFTALEFTIVMPENATLGNAAMMTARSNGHQVKTQAVAPGRYNMMVFAPSGMPLRDGTTALLRFDFTGCQPGDIAIEGTQLVNSRYETVLPTGVVTTVTGIEADGDADGQPYYNTVGIGVKSPTRGVYIKNGKKVVVK